MYEKIIQDFEFSKKEGEIERKKMKIEGHSFKQM